MFLNGDDVRDARKTTTTGAIGAMVGILVVGAVAAAALGAAAGIAWEVFQWVTS